jgi:hypothetical protein
MTITGQLPSPTAIHISFFLLKNIGYGSKQMSYNSFTFPNSLWFHKKRQAIDGLPKDPKTDIVIELKSSYWFG